MMKNYIVVGLGALLATSSVNAADYPNRPITLIVTTAAGGPNDTVGRLVAAQLAEELRQPLVVENIAGAGGNIAARRAATASPDGYTVLLMSTSLAVNPSLYPSVQYDPVTSYRAIGLIGVSPHIIATSPQSGLTSLAAILQTAKKKPGTLTYGSGGNGTTSHLGMELLKSMEKVDILHVPYRGAGPAMIDATAGRVDMVMFPVPSLEQFVRAGKVSAVGITDAKRLENLPDVPTAAEAGAKNLNVLGWWGLVAPAGTPPEAIEVLDKALARALKAPRLVEGLKGQGVQIRPTGAKAFSDFIAEETKKWSGIVKASGAKVDN